MNGSPNFLVLDKEGNLHAYYRQDLLKIDLRLNQDNPPQQVFKLAEGTLELTYRPISISELIPPVEPALLPSANLALITTTGTNERTLSHL